LGKVLIQALEVPQGPVKIEPQNKT